ncbi:hypothetical protein ACP70R_003230 [Stipagrostis hirtigluma subsp. patula]
MVPTKTRAAVMTVRPAWPRWLPPPAGKLKVNVDGGVSRRGYKGAVAVD